MYGERFLDAATEMLTALKLDLGDPNFKDTPARMQRMYKELLCGLYVDLDAEISKLFSANFPATYNGMVTFTNISSFSVCPHHMLPVHYRVDLAYMPGENVVGLSKLPRLVKLLAARPVLQEQLTTDIASNIEKGLKAQGVMVVVSGWHMCVAMRGVRDERSRTITSAVKGIFSYDASAKQEFLDLITQSKREGSSGW